MPRVIKESQSIQTPCLGRLSAFNVVDFALQAHKMVAEARAQSAALLADAQADARQITEQAHQQGHKQGHVLGYEKGLTDGQADGAEKAFNEAMAKFNQQTADLQTMLKQTIRQLDEAREDILRQARADLLALSLTIAEKITRIQARGDIEAAKANLTEAIDMVSSRTQLQVRVCPAQLDQLREYAGQCLADLGEAESVKFVADDQLQSGDVVVKTRNGQVDGRIETQIEMVIDAVTGRARAGS
ncbi:MAG: hypothetical protein HQ546_02790 [Planctomycetes bacterium]|nr:hypothetical protein [Planctomycetota bacterium]